MDSRTKLLLGILASVALSGAWHWIGPGAPETAAPPELSSGAGRPAAAVRSISSIRVPVEHVEEPLFAALAVRPVHRVPGRDPWRFGETPRPAARFMTPPAVRPPAAEPAPPVPVPLAPAAVQAPEPPLFPWRYLGSFGPADRRIAVFTDGASVYNRREGEVLADGFVLERIGLESVDVRPLQASGAPSQRLAPGAGPGRGVS